MSKIDSITDENVDEQQAAELEKFGARFRARHTDEDENFSVLDLEDKS